MSMSTCCNTASTMLYYSMVDQFIAIGRERLTLLTLHSYELVDNAVNTAWSTKYSMVDQFIAIGRERVRPGPCHIFKWLYLLNGES